MRRRIFIGSIGALWVGRLCDASAQSITRKPRIAIILTTSPQREMLGDEPQHVGIRAFVEKMKELGYIDGKSFILERRSAEGKFERFSEIITKLVDERIEVIVTAGNEMALAAKRVTKTVPIVMESSYDPVGAGIVTSLGRPGGNITGFTVNTGPEFETKRLEFLKALMPTAARVAFLAVKSEWDGPQGGQVRNAAESLNLSLLHAEHTPTDYTIAFSSIIRAGVSAIFVSRHPANFANRRLIAEFAAEQRLPGMFPSREFVVSGGLMSYGVNVPDLFRRSAEYVDKILRGTNPGDLPVEQPSKFEFVVNLSVAKALGLTVPPSILVAADEIIE